MKVFHTFGFAVAMAAVSLPANAASLFTFTGIGTVSGTNTQAATDAGIDVGDAASITFTFDADTLDVNSNAQLGAYLNPFSGEIVGVFGDQTFRVDGPGQRMDIDDGLLSSADSFTGDSNLAAASDSGIFSGQQLQFRFVDRDETAFSSDALPTSLDLSDFTGSFDRAEFQVTGGSIGTVAAAFSSVTITAVPAVPLPASVPLLIGGLGMLAMLRRKRA